jgi:hypothetical protein
MLSDRDTLASLAGLSACKPWRVSSGAYWLRTVQQNCSKALDTSIVSFETKRRQPSWPSVASQTLVSSLASRNFGQDGRTPPVIIKGSSV